MKIIEKICFVFCCLILSLGIAGDASAQMGQEKPRIYNQTPTTSGSAPINLNQILSGKTGSSVANVGSTPVQPYTPSGGAAYTMSMTPTQVMQSRARRDAYAQAQEHVTTEYMNQSYLEKDYQQAFQKYQAQFRSDSGSSGGSSTANVPTNVKVKYNRKKKQNFVTPQRVFTAY